MSDARPQPAAPEAWTVERRWIPRLGSDTLWHRFWVRARRTFRRAGETADPASGCGDVVGEGIVGAIAFVVFLAVLVFVVVPLFVALVDVVILLVLAILAVIARVVFRRPWLIEARNGDGRVLRWRVVGWRASAERVDGKRDVLGTGVVPADARVIADATLTDG